MAAAVINVTFFPCPDAFIQNGEQCVCEERLQVYRADCIIAARSFIVRKADSTFWMSAQYINNSYRGLILYENCPLEYCKSNTINITLEHPDIQCNYNRRGVLCGACAANCSLILGGPQCQVCSNTYLALLVPFAAAGIALVAFLSFIRLTVATGVINGLILYANIIQANKRILLPDSMRSILSVFIAWLNLDLGIQSCFYDGLDAYAQTWLQFAFPVYIWTLIWFIVLASRYSMTVSRLIGSNPIAVLATLLLMSYTKILKIIVDVYSSADLDYPHNKIVTVWLKDANVPYLQSKHLLLAVVTSVALVFFFLPYTFLLLVGHKLYRYSDRRIFHWLNRMKPLLDAYHAPYKSHARYWTRFLLLVRCVLYIVFFEATNASFVAISITFGIISGYLASGRIYNTFTANIIEASLYINLVVLSAATAVKTNTPALVSTLVGTAFTTMIGIIAYHFHLSYTAKSAVWLKLRAKLIILKKTTTTGRADPAVRTPLSANPPSHGAQQKTKTTVALREPLIGTDQ